VRTSVKPNLQLIYVSDIERSTAFYSKLFNLEPTFNSPRYVAFSAGTDALFAIWTGGTTPDYSAPRYSEVGIMLSTNEEVDQLFNEWQEVMELDVIQEPSTEVFGRTFLIKDPDGHYIRVSPLDN
jgi:predicted enzyme related to lactoylglutathione lyase